MGCEYSRYRSLAYAETCTSAGLPVEAKFSGAELLGWGFASYKYHSLSKRPHVNPWEHAP
jgi:hypothetical protein